MNRKPSYKQIETAARVAHEANYLNHGEGYATADEMKMHRDDPLACDDLVLPAVAAVYGFEDAYELKQHIHRVWRARA